MFFVTKVLFSFPLMSPVDGPDRPHKGDKHIKYGTHFLGPNFLYVTRLEYEKAANKLRVIAKNFSLFHFKSGTTPCVCLSEGRLYCLCLCFLCRILKCPGHWHYARDDAPNKNERRKLSPCETQYDN